MLDARRKLLVSTVSSVLERDVRAPLTGGNTPDGIRWRQAESGDFEKWNTGSIPLEVRQIRGAIERLKSGSVCLIALHEDSVVHVCWLNTGRIDTLPFETELGPGWAYFSRSRTAEGFRSIGLHKAGLRRRIELAESMGVRRVIALIDRVNPISLANALSMGFAATGAVTELSVASKWMLPRMPGHIRARFQAPASEVADGVPPDRAEG